MSLFGDFGISYLGMPSTAVSPIVFVGGRTQAIPASKTANTLVSLSGTLTGGIASSPSAGDLVVVGYSANNNNAAFNVQMITAGYTEEADLQSPTNTFDAQFGVYTKIVSGGETSFTVGPTGSNADAGAVVVQVWRGVNTSTPMDVAGVVANSSGTGATKPNPGPITPVTQGAMIVITGTATAETNTFTVMGDLTNLHIQSTSPCTGIGSIPWSGSGAYDCAAWSGGGGAGATSGWCTYAMALRPI